MNPATKPYTAANGPSWKDKFNDALAILEKK